MQFIVGRIVIVGNNHVIKTDKGSFSSVILVIKKRMNGKFRNIAFKCYGKVADKVRSFRINDKLEIEFFIYSQSFKKNEGSGEYENWNTTLQAKAVDLYIGNKKWNEKQIKIDD